MAVLRYLTRFLFILALAFFASGEASALMHIRAPQNDLAGPKTASGIFSETIAMLRHAAASQAVELQQEKTSRSYDFAPASPLAAESAPAALGRGSTANLSKGTTLPRNLREQLAVEQATRAPQAGSQLPIKMTDPRWPASDGWVKMQQVINSGGREGPINVHYVRNTITGAVDDFKIVVPGAR